MCKPWLVVYGPIGQAELDSGITIAQCRLVLSARNSERKSFPILCQCQQRWNFLRRFPFEALLLYLLQLLMDLQVKT